MTLLTLDPGLRDSGVALFEDGKLAGAWLARNPLAGSGAPAWYSMAVQVAAVSGYFTGAPPDTVAVELMQSYALKGQKGDQNDLIELAGVAGAVIGLVKPDKAVSYQPREWKGNLPKDVHHERLRLKLTPEETEVLTAYLKAIPASLQHNTLDAVGIGLFQLGRLKGTVKPR